MHPRNVACSILLLTVLSAPVAVGQTVQGRLSDALNATPIDRAFLVLLRDGAEVARTPSDAEGRFRLRAPQAGTYQLRSERIGFQATVSEPFQLADGEVHEMNMHVEPVVIRLDAIVIEGDAKKCRVVGEQGLETATVWEEARKALTNVAWTSRQQQLTYEIQITEQYFEATGRPNYSRESTVRRTSVMPFGNLDPSELQERGYVIEDSSIYYAPDAEVFFSGPFLDHHCFKLERDKDNSGLVGLAFEPARGSKAPDVKGTLWLDEETAELRWLELGYTKLRSHTRRRHARARIDFVQLPNGLWIVSGWWFRMPIVEIEVPRVSGATYRNELLHGFEEDSRRVLRVFRTTGELLMDLAKESG